MPPESDRFLETGRSVVLDELRELRLAVMQMDSRLNTALEVQRVRDDVFVQSFQSHDKRLQDYEQRLRVLEARRYVEPKTVWAAVTVMVTIGGLIVAIINLITK